MEIITLENIEQLKKALADNGGEYLGLTHSEGWSHPEGDERRYYFSAWDISSTGGERSFNAMTGDAGALKFANTVVESFEEYFEEPVEPVILRPEIQKSLDEYLKKYDDDKKA